MKKLFFAGLSILFIYACNEHKKDEATEIKHDTLETVPADTNTTADDDRERDDFSAARKERMDRLDRRMDSLEARWKDKKRSGKDDYEVRRKDMRDRSSELRTRLDSSRMKSKENWQEFKRDVDEDLDELERKMEDLFDDDEPKKDK